MIDKYNVDYLGFPVERRDNDIFGENDKASVDKMFEHHPENYLLIELKSLVLSLDWEITDEVIKYFMTHTDNLIEFYRNDKFILGFLNILQTLGNYVDANRSKAHPECFKILNSVYFTLEDVILAKDMLRTEKVKLLKIEIEKYKALRELVFRRKLTKSREKEQYSLTKIVPKVVKSGKADCVQVKSENRMLVISQKQLNDLKNDIMQFIHSEIVCLKDELRNLKYLTKS